MAIDDGQRHLRRLHRRRDPDKARQVGGKAAPLRGQRPCIVADDVEDPEDHPRPRHLARHPAVEIAQEPPHPLRRGAQIRLAPGPRLDEARHHDTGRGMDHLGREARRMGGPRGHHLIGAGNMMKRKILAEADHMRARRVRHLPAFVGQAPGQRLRRDLTPPAGQRPDTFDTHAPPTSSLRKILPPEAPAPATRAPLMPAPPPAPAAPAPPRHRRGSSGRR